MATTGILQRRDYKASLITGTPSNSYPDSNWTGPVIEGEFVYAVDTFEIGFLDSNGSLVWRKIDDFGGLPAISLNDLTDVDTITVAPTDLQVLQWNTTNSLWEPGTVSSGDVSTGLEKIEGQSGEFGWRLIDKDPTYFGTIGNNAVDFSSNDDGSSIVYGATGDYSAAFGYQTIASGKNSTAFGRITIAEGNYSVAFGSQTIASEDYSTAFGYKATASENYSTAFGYRTTASGEVSTAFGDSSVASGEVSVAFGSYSTASGNFSAAFGHKTTASNLGSIAFGMATGPNDAKIISSGYGSIAGGGAYNTDIISSGMGSISLGYETKAETAKGTVALGLGTKANNEGQIALGKYNGRVYGEEQSVSPAYTNTILEVGIGTSSNPKNAFEVFLNGTATLPDIDNDKITVCHNNFNGKAIPTTEWVLANGGGASELEKVYDVPSGEGQTTDGWRLLGLNANLYGTTKGVNLGNNSSVSSTGYSTLAIGYSDDDNSIIESRGYGSIAGGRSQYRTNIYASGSGSFAFGTGHGGEGGSALIEASGNGSIALGYSGNENSLRATKKGSISLGYATKSLHKGSVALGHGTETSDDGQTVAGIYNIIENSLSGDLELPTQFKVGIGSDSSNLKTAFEVYLSGKVLAPSLETNLITDDKCLITKEYADANYSGGGSSGLLVKDGLGYRISGLTSDTLGTDSLNLSTMSNATCSSGGISMNGYSTGAGAIAIGSASLASNNYNTSIGAQCQTTADYAVAIGGKNARASGISSTALGSYASATGNNSISIGNKSYAKQNYSFAQGYYSTSNSAFGVTFGTYNVGKNNSSFEIGNGGYNAPSNSFEVLKNGTILAPQLTNTLLDGELSDSKCLITKDYAETNYKGGGASELEKVGSGWRILGLSTVTPGTNAVSLSNSSTSIGATGYAAFTAGYNVEANDTAAVAIGNTSKANAASSLALGRDCNANGISSTAIGNKNTASGGSSFAAGYNSTAGSSTDISIGINAISAAVNATALGYGVLADIGGATALGRYNEGGNTNIVLEIGNGDWNSGSPIRSNALEVYTTGEIVAPDLTEAQITAATGKVLVTKEYLEANGDSGSLIESEFTATASQIDFIISSEVFTTAMVFSEGVRLRETIGYTISDNGTDTTVTLVSAATAGDWIQVTRVG